MILGLLANLGPRHGHQIRRVAEQTEVAGWGGVSYGSLYRELRLMEREGLVVPLRTEQVGSRPVRTVYQISDAGRGELRALWRQAVREPSFHGPDALAVALLFGKVLDKSEMAELLRARRKDLDDILAFVADERTRGQASGELGAIDSAVFRRGEARLEAELRWHDEFERVLEGLPGTKATEGAGRAGAGQAKPKKSTRSARKHKGRGNP
jgi:DNA-binding PadR family transcriptional regulator